VVPTPRGSTLAGGPVQVAYGIDPGAGIESAARWWVEHQGAGPFFVRHHIPVTEVALAGGRPGTFDHSSAYGQWGGLMVELVAIHDPPELRSVGLHHVAHVVDSYAHASSELTARGWPPVLQATAGTTRFAFHDARADLGHLIEIYPASDALLGFYRMVARAADGWDGADPVRLLGGI